MRIDPIIAGRGPGRSGSALLSSLVIVVVLSGIALSALTMTMAHKREVSLVSKESRAFYLAEAGLSDAVLQLTTARNTGDLPPLSIGTSDSPIELKNGEYFCTLVENDDASFTVTSTGVSNLRRTTLEAVVAPNPGGIWDHAIFAGNINGDPAYTLNLGGAGGQADEIDGNIYSGQDVIITEDASVTGDIHAVGSISGMAGDEGKSHLLPDIDSMNYETEHDFDIAAMFAADGVMEASDLGGNALQVPEDNPAHIFRLNPDDRLDEITETTKDDYFLEDPYMPVKDYIDPESGEEGHTISISGSPGEPGPEGTKKLYYIDGNLWVHNKSYLDLRVKHTGPDGAKITFVVKGNIYFCDDVDTVNKNVDGLAFIAIEDELEADSGNIYLGDPRYGTLDKMEAFMYAENNFYDNNLDESGSKIVRIIGNMTASNQVDIQRDFVDTDGNVQHSKLNVDFDDRLSTGKLVLPGLPSMGLDNSSFSVVFWREVENPE